MVGELHLVRKPKSYLEDGLRGDSPPSERSSCSCGSRRRLANEAFVLLFAVLPWEEGALAELAVVCGCSTCSSQARTVANDAVELVAVLPWEEDSPAVHLAELAEVSSCSVCSSQARRAPNDALELAASFSSEDEELPALFLLSPVVGP